MFSEFDRTKLKELYIPSPKSHKGQNGKLMIIGGSHLFHVASLWALQIASRIVDMVFYSSVPENNAIVKKAKEEFRNGIVIERENLEHYIYEADCILIGPGMVREDYKLIDGLADIQSLKDIESFSDSEGEQTYYLTGYLLKKYPQKKWVLDAGSLQMMDPSWLTKLSTPAVVTPHKKEFETLFSVSPTLENICKMASKYNCIILLKGQEDIVCPPSRGEAGSPTECIKIVGGNAGMTKGGTGDVLAGLVAALACKNDPFLAAIAGSYINKKAGDELYKRVGYYFNASDLADEIPKVMNMLIT